MARVALRLGRWQWRVALCAGASVSFVASTRGQTICDSQEAPGSFFDFIVVGNGVAGKAAVETLKSASPSSSLLVVADEDRPRWGTLAADETSTWARDSIRRIDTESKFLVGETGNVYRYGRCLLAMGTKASRPPDTAIVDKKAGHLVGNAKLARDRQRLSLLLQDSGDLRESPRHVTVFGGDWNSLAVANSLVCQGAQVTLVCSEPAPLASHLPRYLCDSILSLLKERRVDLAPYSILRYVVAREGEAELVLSRTFNAQEGLSLRTDFVVLAETRGASNASLLSSGSVLESNDVGLVTNCELSVASDVYAAGDGLSLPDPQLGFRRRTEGVHQAEATGIHAARNMSGGRKPFRSVAVRHLDLGSGLGVELMAIGHVCSSLDTVSWWANEHGSPRRVVGGADGHGAVFYLDANGKPVGVLLWNASEAASPAAEYLSGPEAWPPRFEDPRAGGQDLARVAAGLLGQGGRERTLTRRAVQGRAQPLPLEETLWKPFERPRGPRKVNRPPEFW